MDEMTHIATEDEAHREWHLNAGIPIGTAGCPWDACDGEGHSEPWIPPVLEDDDIPWWI